MGLIDALTGYFTKARDAEGSKITPTGYEAAAVGFNNVSDIKTKEYLESMKGWVGACVTAIADQVASVDIKLYEIKKGEVEEVLEHEVLDLLFRVNSFTTKFDHFWLTQSYLELTGEAPWFLESDGKTITNIFFLRPDKIRPIVGKSRMIEGYEYEIGPGQKIKLENEEVLFLKYPNPAKPFRGIGTLEMAAITVDIDNYSEQWNKEFYANSARPDSIVTVNTPNLQPDQKQKLMSSFNKAHKGTANAHKTMLLFGDMKFEKAGFNQRDMDFLEQQRFSRDKILGIFRVPKAIVSQTEGVNFASAKVAEYNFAKFTIKPKMERLIQQLNEFLLPMFPNAENLFLDFDSPVPADTTEDMSRYDNALKHGWMTINEVRAEQNLEPVEGGDDIHIPSNVATPNQNGEAGKEETRTLHVKRKSFKTPSRLTHTKVRGKSYFKREKTAEEQKTIIRKALIGEIESKKREAKIKKNAEGELQRVLTETEIKEFWVAKNQIYTQYAPKLTAKLIEIFKAQRKSTLIKLAKKEQASDDFFNDVKLDEVKEIQKTINIVIPLLTELFLEAGAETYALLELDAEMALTDEISNIIDSKAREFALSVTQTTNEFIKEQITEGLKAGESVAEIRSRIVNVFDEAESFRADRIARTETLRYNSRASEQAFMDSGLVEAKMWVTDPNPCEFCATLAGKVAPLGSNFVKKGDTITPVEGTPRVFDYENLPTPPLHPNCQCDIVPIFKTQKVVVPQK